MRVERSGAERRLYSHRSGIFFNIHTVDVVNTSGRATAIIWKRKRGWLTPYLPEEVVKHYDKRYYDAEGSITTRILISPIAYNTNLVKKEDAPKGFRDLLDPKWKGKLVKAHPAYSGTIMNSTFETARDLGWDYFVKLAAQNVMQVQSATDTPKRISLGERAVMVDGAGYLVIRYKEAGQPVDIIYPEEGTPLAGGPSAVFKAAPNPNAARLFQNWMHSREGQQLIVDDARQYSAHGQTAEKPGIRKLADIKLMKEVRKASLRKGRRSKSDTQKFSRCDDNHLGGHARMAKQCTSSALGRHHAHRQCVNDPKRTFPEQLSAVR